MNSGKQALLIRCVATTEQVHQVHILEDAAFVAPLHWAMRSNSNYYLCLPNMTCAAAKRVQLIGLAKPRDLGLPTLSHFYFLAIFFGIFTLSIPVKLRPVVTESRPISHQELVERMIEAVRNNPAAYTRASAVEIEHDLVKARTFGQVRKSFGN